MNHRLSILLFTIIVCNSLYGAAPRNPKRSLTSNELSEAKRSYYDAQNKTATNLDCVCARGIDPKKHPNLAAYYRKAHREESPHGISTVLDKDGKSYYFRHFFINTLHGNNPNNANCFLVALLFNFAKMKSFPEGLEDILTDILDQPTLEEQLKELREFIYERCPLEGRSIDFIQKLDKFGASMKSKTPLSLLKALPDIFNIRIAIFSPSITKTNDDLDNDQLLKLRHVAQYNPTISSKGTRTVYLLRTNSTDLTAVIDPMLHSSAHIEPLILIK